MTLVVDRDGDAPQVHALVIGVGGYRHLPGGAEPVPHGTLGLRQLTGPPPSAKAFAEWLTSRLRHPTAQLGSIEMLLSPSETWAPSGQTPVDVEVPSMDSVSDAFDRWFARCDEDPRNVAIFYFCGHGVEKESQFLLLEDFGRTKQRLMENAVDIGATYVGMATCQAREQYFFVDACREIRQELLEELSGQARALVTPKAIADTRENEALLFATSGGAKAYGRAGRPTQFTAAVIRALDGLGSRPEGNGWVVDYPGLLRVVTMLLHTRGDDGRRQRPTVRGGASGVLHVCADPPVVPVAIACEPAAAVAAARAAFAPLYPPDSAPLTLQQVRDGWRLDVPADVYLLTLDFPTGGYRPTTEKIVAYPPGLSLPVAVTS